MQEYATSIRYDLDEYRLRMLESSTEREARFWQVRYEEKLRERDQLMRIQQANRAIREKAFQKGLDNMSNSLMRELDKPMVPGSDAIRCTSYRFGAEILTDCR